MGSLSNLLPFFFKTNSRKNELIRTEILFQFITPGYEIIIIWNQKRKSLLRLKDIQRSICTKPRQTPCSFLVIRIKKVNIQIAISAKVHIRQTGLYQEKHSTSPFRTKYFPVASLTYYTIRQVIFVRISYHSFWKWIPQRTSSSEEKSD